MKRLMLIGLTALLAGCTQQSAPEATSSSEPPAASSTPAPEGTTEPAPETQTAAAPAATSSTSTLTARPLPGHWQEGTHYELITPSQATTVDAGQVEIIEFLWLGCAHCYELNPYIESWRANLPADVAFRQEHVTWDAQRLPHARLFYTLRALGADKEVVAKAFDEIHRKGNYLMATTAAASQKLQEEFAAANGLDVAAFQRQYNGFTVNSSINRADDLIRRYKIGHVPILIVNGKYRTDVGMAGGPGQLIQLLSDLAASEKIK